MGWQDAPLADQPAPAQPGSPAATGAWASAPIAPGNIVAPWEAVQPPAQTISTGRDVGLGVGQGMLNAAGDIAGAPMDLASMVENAPGWLIGHGAKLLGYPETAKMFLDEYNGANDPKPASADNAARVAGQFFSHPGAAQITGLLDAGANAGKGQADPSAPYAPQTLAGRLALGATEGAGNAAAFGGTKSVAGLLANTLLTGVLPGAAGAGAGELTQGTAMEPYARVASQVLTGGAGSLPRAFAAMKGAAGRTLAGQLSGLSDQQLAGAQALLDQSHAVGAPLTGFEAIHTAAGGGTNLPALGRITEQSPAGGPVMADFMGQRPAQNAAAVDNALSQIAPKDPSLQPSFGPNASPYDVPGRVGDAATQLVQRAEKDRTEATRPFYRAAEQQTVPPDQITGILDDINKTIGSDNSGLLGNGALAQMRGMLTKKAAVAGDGVVPPSLQPLQTPAIAQAYDAQYGAGAAAEALAPHLGSPAVPVTDIGSLDRARKYLRDNIDLPNFSANATDKANAAALMPQLDALRESMVQASPDFEQGLATHADISRTVVDPLKRSPVGQLAATAGQGPGTIVDPVAQYGQQANILFSPSPLPGSHVAIGNAVASVAGVDPEAAASLVRMKIQQTADEAMQANMGGPNQFGGAKFAAFMRGNPQQAANLQAAITALPNGQEAWRQFNATLNTLEAQGARAPFRSDTAQNQALNESLHKGNPFAEGSAELIGDPLKPLGFLQRQIEQARYTNATGGLARAATAPDAVQQFLGMAAQGANSTGPLARVLSGQTVPLLSQPPSYPQRQQ